MIRTFAYLSKLSTKTKKPFCMQKISFINQGDYELRANTKLAKFLYDIGIEGENSVLFTLIDRLFLKNHEKITIRFCCKQNRSTERNRYSFDFHVTFSAFAK